MRTLPSYSIIPEEDLLPTTDRNNLTEIPALESVQGRGRVWFYGPLRQWNVQKWMAGTLGISCRLSQAHRGPRKHYQAVFIVWTSVWRGIQERLCVVVVTRTSPMIICIWIELLSFLGPALSGAFFWWCRSVDPFMIMTDCLRSRRLWMAQTFMRRICIVLTNWLCAMGVGARGGIEAV